MNKLFYFVVVAVALGVAVLPAPTAGADCGGKNKTHNFFFGNRGYNDRMVFMDNPRQPGSFMRKLSANVTYPLKGHRSEGNITYIEVLDQYRNGTGGCAYLTNGGVGNNHFSLHIKSGCRGCGFNFVVKAFARTFYG